MSRSAFVRAVIPGTLIAFGCYSEINGWGLHDSVSLALHEPLSRLLFDARQLLRANR